MVSGCTALYEIVVYIYNLARNQIPLEILAFCKILFIEILFNVLLTTILYPLIKKGGYILENIFKKKKILTRYF